MALEHVCIQLDKVADLFEDVFWRSYHLESTPRMERQQPQELKKKEIKQNCVVLEDVVLLLFFQQLFYFAANE